MTPDEDDRVLTDAIDILKLDVDDAPNRGMIVMLELARGDHRAGECRTDGDDCLALQHARRIVAGAS